MQYLLDTNAWIVYLKDPNSSIRPKLASISPCLRYGFVLVTNNVSEFSRVSGLKVQDWT
jgi:predicted nucleic acid-binding protein